MKHALVGRTALASLIALYATLSGARAFAQGEAEAPAPPEHPATPARPRHDLVRVNAGLRIGYVTSRGFDAFASNDVLAQFSIDGTYPLYTRGRVVLGAGLGWDVGGRSDRLRGFDSTLTTHRLYVPVEARYHLLPSLLVFGKLSPGAAVAIATIEDPSSPRELSATGWAFSGDASVGASILLGPRAKMERRLARFWLTPEIGWSYTTGAPLHPNPDREAKDVLGSDEDATLRSVALSGFFWRASLGATF